MRLGNNFQNTKEISLQSLGTLRMSCLLCITEKTLVVYVLA